MTMNMDATVILHPILHHQVLRIDIEELMEKARVFQQMPTRSHSSFPNFSCNPIRKLDWNKFKTWLDKQAKSKGCSCSSFN